MPMGTSEACGDIADMAAILLHTIRNELPTAGSAFRTLGSSAHIPMIVPPAQAAGIKKQMRIVTAPLKQASALHIIPADPGVGIRLPARCHIRKAEASVEAYSQEEQEALRREPETFSRPAYAVILLMLETGLRAGEALALRWRDIHLSRKRLEVRSTVVRLAYKKQSYVQDSAKSEASNRVIPLTPYAVRVLERLSQGGRGEWVFTDGEGDRLSYEALRYQTQCACRDAGIAYKGEHFFAIPLRPTAITKEWM